MDVVSYPTLAIDSPTTVGSEFAATLINSSSNLDSDFDFGDGKGLYNENLHTYFVAGELNL